MKINYNSLIKLLISLTIGFFIGTAAKEVYNLTAKQPCSWKQPPIIINCIDTIDEETIKRAVKYWSSKGEEIYFYEYRVISNICDNPTLTPGLIIIAKEGKNKLEDAVLASTSRSSKLGDIISAIIYFKPGTENLPLLLEHELGHAFGYTHRKITGNIMNPYYDLMGTRFRSNKR